jgi:hypothetical protein
MRPLNLAPSFPASSPKLALVPVAATPDPFVHLLTRSRNLAWCLLPLLLLTCTHPTPLAPTLAVHPPSTTHAHLHPLAITNEPPALTAALIIPRFVLSTTAGDSAYHRRAREPSPLRQHHLKRRRNTTAATPIMCSPMAYPYHHSRSNSSNFSPNPSLPSFSYPRPIIQRCPSSTSRP